MSGARAELPEGWGWVRLGDVAEINPRRALKLERDDDTLTTFVPMPAVYDLTGAITAPEVKAYGAVKKGYTYFEEGDVIFAKITPCMQNGKHAVARGLLDGFAFGSTEFHVIRCGQSLLPEWIHFFVRQPSTLREAEGRMTGAVGQQRVPKEFLADLEIPLPPLEEQQRILGTLHLQMVEVDKARAATEAQLEAAAKLPDAFLREVFESEQAQEWSRRPLGEVCEITAKLVDPKLLEYKVLPHVSGENIQSGLCQLINVKTAEEDGMTSGKYIFEAGNVLYSKLRPYLRKVALAEFRGLCSADMYPLYVNPDVLTPEFTAWVLLSEEFTVYADGQSRRSRMPKLNREQLFSWNIPCPPLEEQVRIASRLTQEIRAHEDVKMKLTSQLETINALPASLLRQAFSGELTRQLSPEALRAALICLAVARLYHRPFFGVVQLMKVFYFAQVHHGIPLGCTIRRHKHGPFDKAVYDLEEEGERQGWFSVDKTVDKQGSRYIPGADLESRARDAEETLSRWKGELDGLLELAESFDTTGLEALATLHAAWNDLLLAGRQPTDGEIISEVLECWPGKAEKFSKGELRQYLAYLKASPYTPKGTGQSTRLTHAA